MVERDAHIGPRVFRTDAIPLLKWEDLHGKRVTLLVASDSGWRVVLARDEEGTFYLLREDHEDGATPFVLLDVREGSAPP